MTKLDSKKNGKNSSLAKKKSFIGLAKGTKKVGNNKKQFLGSPPMRTC